MGEPDQGFDAEALRSRLYCGPQGLTSAAPQSFSRAGRAAGQRQPARAMKEPKKLFGSRSTPGLLTQDLTAESALATMSKRHVLMKPHRMQQGLLRQSSSAVTLPPGARSGAALPPRGQTASTFEGDFDGASARWQTAMLETAMLDSVVSLPENAAAAPRESTFLESLHLTAAQMDSFVEDAGSFLYLSHATPAVEKRNAGARHDGSVYDLVVVAHADVDPSDYFTLSCSGTTHFTGEDSEFSPLQQWEREYGLYHRMRRITFFRKYRAWKTFSTWKKNVKQRKIKGAVASLKGSLFLFVPALRDALLKVQALCQQTVSLRLLEARSGKTYELADLAEAQRGLLRLRAESLVLFSSHVQSLARAACDHVVDAFLQAAKIVADHRMTFMERASLRSECRKLTRFLRLVDFHVVSTLRDLALESAAAALELVCPQQSPQNSVDYGVDDFGEAAAADSESEDDDGEFKVDKYAPLLRIEVSFAQGKPAFTPSLIDVQRAFEAIISDSLKVIGIPDRIFAHPDLALYIMSDADDAADAQGREDAGAQPDVSTEPSFKRTCAGIQARLAECFKGAEEHSVVFAPFHAEASANAQFLEDHRGAFGAAQGNVDLVAYAKAVVEYRAQVVAFADQVPRSADVGVLRVDSVALKSSLAPSPRHCLAALEAHLPQLMDAGFKVLLDKLGELLPVVTGNPPNVTAFVTKKRVVREAQEAFEGFKADQQKLVAMAALMEAEAWDVPEDQKAHLVMADENMTTLETGVQIAEGREEEDTKRFAAEIADEVPRLVKAVGAVREQLDQASVASLEEAPDAVLAFLDQQASALGKLKARSATLADYQQELAQDVYEYDTMDEVSADLALKLRLWRGVKEWSSLTAGWVVSPLGVIDTDELEKQVLAYNKTVFQASKGLPGNPVVPRLKESVDQFTPVLPVVVNLRNTSLQDRHWAAIHQLVGFKIQGDAAFTLGDIVDKGVSKFHAEITAIATNATQESVLEEMMAKVTTAWSSAELPVLDYKDVKDLFILGDTSEVIASLDESLVTVNTVLGSRYVGGIRPFVEKWRKDLMLFQDTLDEWLACQRAWMYLESIFSSPDIIRQLPAAAKQFAAVDKSWKAIMKTTADDAMALKACCVKDRRETFVSHNATLDKIQKSLEEYLETKCAAFPRFYFLSNDELLEILSQSKDPQAVQPHMRKCFDNLVKLEFGDEPGSMDIHAMFSGEGERVALGKNLKARGNVEDWLTAVEQRMKQSLNAAMKVGLVDYDGRARSEWVLDHPGQIVATVAQMTWARDTEAAFSAEDEMQGMHTWFDANVDSLRALIEKIRGPLPSLQRHKIVALVTTDVHARDIVEELCQKRISTKGDFLWMQQLRYYWEMLPEGEDCLIRHSDAEIGYGYEYMGCTSRLVITPLTDRCWLTLTGSYGLKLGAAPAGPAGTGKTESSKDLAKAMAIQCVVFNCSDQIDYKMMGKLFRGLAQSGSWTCLDEFNRIDIEVLSVIAQQLLVLREGRVAQKTSINFMGVEIRLVDHHVIITMNPGYAGRTELPDNLQVCFRPVSMMVPNYALIAEIMLFAEGFGDAKTLSRKMCKLYILCSEQLSQQPHYDYGLRAVKSVLVMAGGLKRDNPTIPEDLVLIRALRDSNLPKFLADDIPLFFAIIADLFPGVVVPENDYGEFQTTMEAEISKAGLQNVPGFHTKVIQMFDIFNIRFGATLVGPTGSGKSTCYRILAAIMGSLFKAGSANPQYQEVKFEILNPKCITMGELYGEVNSVTQEWRDGLASTIMRRAVGDESQVRKWTVFDGPIDALWIENMNTVLDDNMTLCLANGERIKLKVEMKMLFEVMDLAVASPATVSRIGVVFLTPSDLGWMPYVTSWSKRFNVSEDAIVSTSALEPARARVCTLFGNYFQKTLTFQRRKLKEPVGCVEIQLATSCATLFESLFAQAPFEAYAKAPEALLRLVEKLFFFALVWSVGGSINADGHQAFDAFVRDLFEQAALDLPPTGLCYDYFVSTKAGDKPGGKFEAWKKMVPNFAFDKSAQYTAIVVPTEDTTRFSFLMRTLIVMDKPVFVTGVTGTGKTVMVQSQLKALEPSVEDGGLGVLPIFLNFSAQTLSLVTQATIESKLEKKRKNLLGAPAGRRVVCFVDDINMPLVESYGAQAPVELMRQFLDYRGFYDRSKLFWKDVTDMIIFTAAAPPGGGRAEVTPRFTRHFNVLCVPPASESVLTLIFESIFAGFMHGFEKDLQRLVKPVVAATIEVYNTISSELLPTPAKFHYSFNLRDVSKVFQGLLMVTPAKVKDPETLANLWVHEAQRVFYDRLINTDDQAWFERLACDLLTRHLSQPPSTPEDKFGENSVIFADFLRAGVDVESRRYELGDVANITRILNDTLDEYNVSFPTTMNLVFFADAVRHVCRMSRILRQPRGNAMLVGVGGSGKQSTTRMASFISEMPCLQIEISRGYGLKDFREDVKQFMLKTGVEGTPIVFLFTDTQVVEESMLEDINSILNSGEIPNLFPQDELDKICSDMIPVCTALGVPASRDACVATFTQRVWDKLHIVLCMSPVGDALRVRCRQFPSLINCTTIDWFLSWPQSALEKVASHFLSSVHLGSGSDALEVEHREAIVSLCVRVHTSINETGEQFYAALRRRTYTTPKSYLDLINMYSGRLNDLQAQVDLKIEQMTTGTLKLTETEGIVEGLRAELTQLQPVLDEKAAGAEVMLKQVAIDQADADVVREKVAAEEAALKKQSAEVKAIADDAQADLDVAMPALNSAVKALNSLTKNDISEVKAFKSPAPAVKITMEGICIMLERSKVDWDEAKRVLGDAQFLDKLKGYDKDNMKPDVIKKISKYIVMPEMQVELVAKVSSAAKGLCMWIHAMVVYNKVAKDVGPKKARLDEMNSVLFAANASLQEKQDALAAVVSKVAKLQEQCAATVEEKEDLMRAQAQTALRLQNAEKLTSGLASEGVRWKTNLDIFSHQRVALIGDTLLACAAISYYGPFTGSYRAKLVSGWLEEAMQRDLPCSANSSLMDTLGDAVLVREWQTQFLPTDDVSTNNAILVTQGRRWPLMIDPQAQANRWIRKMEEKDGLMTTTMSDINLLRSLESAIRNGKPLLIEDVHEAIEPALETVLQRATFKQGTRTLIRLGDSNVDYDDNFRLYMTSKLPNPHYLPEVCIKVTVINFTVTMEGLEDQLLGDVVKAERPEVERKNVQLVVQMSTDKKKLAEIEAEILRRLSESEGNILDDVDLINTLADSKKFSKMINERLEAAEVTKKEINEAREEYRTVATRGSLLYFVIADLATIDPMYQYSLQYYQALFVQCMHDADLAEDALQRLQILIETSTLVIYANICRGLFEKDKVLFSALLAFSILRHALEIRSAEWNLLIRGAGVQDRTKQPKNPQPAKMPDVSWDMICVMDQLAPAPGSEEAPFPGICKHLTDRFDSWAGWLASSDPCAAALPAPFNETASSFAKLIAIRALRDDKALLSINSYVRQQFGDALADSPSGKMDDIYADLDNATPCIFILSKGTDPTGLLLKLAKQKGFQDRLDVVSLGQGQGPTAEALVGKGAVSGDWVLLQNCMLAKSWMHNLEQMVFKLGEDRATNAATFRLFLTSSPAAYFPVSVLQNGVKMTNEPPKGIRANLLRSYQNLVRPEDFETCAKPQAFKRLLSGLCFFHANILERRKFGPLGWNIRYAFDESDLETSMATTRRFLDDQDRIPYDALLFVTGHINYGGRVTDDWDRRALLTILGMYFTPKVMERAGDDYAPYAFSKSGTYHPASTGALETHTAYFGSLPMVDEPEIFGMHENADITYNRNESAALLTSILVLQPRDGGGGGGGKTADETVLEIIADIASKIPPALDDEDKGPRTFVVQPNGLLTSLDTVLAQEMVKFNRLLSRMRSSLKELHRAINGFVIMSSELDDMYVSFTNNVLPPVWTAVSFATLKTLGSWVKDTVQRVEFFRGWLLGGLPVSFPLPVFFFPQGFMTGTLQTYARKYHVAIDTLQFKYEVLRETEFAQGPEDGILVAGLYLEGARWNYDAWEVTESRVGEIYTKMPVIHFQPAVGHNCAPHEYACPVYKTAERKGVLSTTGMSTNFVVAIELPSSCDPAAWVLAGVACLCNLTD